MKIELINNIEWNGIEWDSLDGDFSDMYIESAHYDGFIMDGEQLDELNNDRKLINELFLKELSNGIKEN